ncbi:MAG: nuclear transport factor 2 family protein [Balneolaceae bacterium]
MSRQILFTGIILTLLTAGCSGNMSESTNQQNSEATEEAVLEAVDGMWDALTAQDLDAFNDRVAPDWVLFTERAERINAEDLIATHSQNLTNFSVDYWNTDVNVRDSVAWVTFDGTLNGLWQGDEWGGTRFLYTLVLHQNSDGEWIVAHMHESEEAESREGTVTSDEQE